MKKPMIYKKVYTMRAVLSFETNDVLYYAVVRNYKNGKNKEIGRRYKTSEGAMRQVRHRNSCHADRYGSSWVHGVAPEGLSR